MCSGASAGIGWAVCEALATAGLRVVAVARRRERLEQLQQTLVAAGVPIADFLPVVCDITKVRPTPDGGQHAPGSAWFKDDAAAYPQMSQSAGQHTGIYTTAGGNCRILALSSPQKVCQD